MSGRAVPRAEGVTFESGSGGMRMEKDRGAAAAVQPLYIRAGKLTSLVTRLVWRPLTWELPHRARLCVVMVCMFCALHGVSPRDRWVVRLDCGTSPRKLLSAALMGGENQLRVARTAVVCQSTDVEKLQTETRTH
jgi:hypothetical protein